MLELPRLEHDVVLAPYTTYKIGGPADLFVEVTGEAELVAAITAARTASVPYFILGTGANILVSDLGFRGLVIHNRSASIVVDAASHTVTAGSGATLDEVIRAASPANLGNLEYFTCVPSSVGGAVRQNFHFIDVDASHWERIGEIIAGETQYLADRVVSGRILMEDGRIETVDHDWFKFAYDYSVMLENPVILLSATFALMPRAEAIIERQIAASAAWRAAKQPLLSEYPSCGSVFINIPGVGAGRLIDQAGLKGRRVGNIQVSPLHANYLVNLGGGTAADVLSLIELIQTTVYEVTGHKLETEIAFIGERV